LIGLIYNLNSTEKIQIKFKNTSSKKSKWKFKKLMFQTNKLSEKVKGDKNKN